MDDNKKVIELINRIQFYQRSTGCNVNLQLPQIAVVGSQSSGKSSVLESLMGKSILPRGSGTVTKCPIILQLITTPNPDEEGVEFENGESRMTRIKDFNLVREKLYEKMNANDGAITDDPIVIRLYSADVVTLTLVDLPGYKRRPSDGEPSDLEQRIRNMICKYITQKNTIILAVSPANYDICNSDGLLLAQEVDPEGIRTIGVLTKLDLMDKGTNARDLLTGTSKDVQLKLGMIGVVNRSQEDTDKNVTIEIQLENEKHYLEKTYSDLVSVNGTPFLRKRLQEILVEKIHACLPGLVKEVEEKIRTLNKRLSNIPNVMSAKDKRILANKIIKDFEGNTKKEIEGSLRHPELNYVYGGIKIRDAFEKEFPKEMEQARQVSSVTDEMIINAFLNSGPYNSFFDYPEAVFSTLAERQVACIEDPALKCAQRVYFEIMTISNRHTKSELLKHFPELRNTLKSVVNKMIENNLDSVNNQIKRYIKLQSTNLFSLDRNFLEKFSDLRRQLESILNNGEKVEGGGDGSNFNPSSEDRLRSKLEKPATIQLIKDMANLYYNLVHGQCLDFIPKLIADNLITQFSTDGTLGDELRMTILENLDALVKLPFSVLEEKKRDSEMKSLMEKVLLEIFETLSFSNYDEESREE